MTTNLKRTAKELLQRWSDPVVYAHDVHGLWCWDKQAEILRACANHPRVSVSSGHKIGKSVSAALLAHWWIQTKKNSLVVFTSSTDRQVRKILWKEFSKLHTTARIPLGGKLAKDPGTGYELPDGRAVYGFSTKDPERMAGISGENLLFIIDEASGVSQDIFEAIEGNRAGGARVAMFSNPTQTSGEFYDSHHSKRQFYKTFRISSTETPNVAQGRTVVSGLATRAWVEEKRQEWGESSPLWAVRVLGEFPGQGDNSVVPLALVTSRQLSEEDEPLPEANAVLELGIDPARYGDDPTAICARRGKFVFPIEERMGLDSQGIRDFALDVIRKYRHPSEHRIRCKVDVIGLGAGAYDFLKEIDFIDAVPVSSSEASDDTEQYTNLRSQLCFAVTEFLKNGGILPEDGKLEGELVAAKYSFDARGRLKVQPKDEIKKQLGRSPNRADALSLAIYSHQGTGFSYRPSEQDSYRFMQEQSRFDGEERGF